MFERPKRSFAPLHLRLIRLIGVIVPRRLRADWRQEWEAELRYRELMLAEWDKLDWQHKLNLLWRSLGAFRDALWLQPQRWEDDMFQDLRYGFRRLLTNPGFTAVAVIALALGIGANTAIFSVVNTVLLRPLPFAEPEGLVKVWPEKYHVAASKSELAELQRESRSFDGLAAYSGWGFTLTGKDEPLKLSGARATAGFFALLGTQAALGRTFAANEDQPGRSQVIVLSHGFWQRYFGADPSVIGQAVTLDGQSHTIIGVLPPSFNFPGIHAEKTDLWVPAPIDPSAANDYTAGYLDLLARLKPGVSPEQAQAEVVTISRALRTKLPRASNDYGDHATVRPLKKRNHRRLAPDAAGLAGSRRLCLAHRVRQCGELATGARRASPERDLDSHRARRWPRAHHSAIAHRKRLARAHRRHGRFTACMGRHEFFDQAAAG